MGADRFPLAFFGKLPALGDFVRLNAASREVQWFDQWLHQGVLFAKGALRSTWDRVFDNGPTVNFVLCPDGSDKIMIGALSPSRDKGGREYPIWVAELMNRPENGSQLLSVLPAAARQFLGEATAFVREVRDALDARQVQQMVEELRPLQAEDVLQQIRIYHEFLRSTSVEKFVGRCLGRFDERTKHGALSTLAHLLGPMRHKDVSKWGLGLRFPLGDEALHANDTAVWLQASMKLLGNPSAAPFLFWTRTSTDPHLYVHFKQPAPRLFAQFISPESSYDSLCKLDEEMPQTADGGERSEVVRLFFHSQARNLDDLILAL
jgi:type VI secretion system protein ImpM